MTGTGGPDRRGRHSSSEHGTAGAPEPRGHEARAFEPRSIDAFAPGHESPHYEPSRYDPSRFGAPARPATAAAAGRPEFRRHSVEAAERVASGVRGYETVSARPLTARHSSEDRPRPGDPAPQHFSDTEHPSAPLPPRPAGVWERLSPRPDGHVDDDATVASSLVPGAPGAPADHDDVTEAHALDTSRWDDSDQTGGLDVIGAHVQDERRGRRGLFRRSRHRAEEHPADDAHDEHADELYDDEHYDDGHDDDDPYDALEGDHDDDRVDDDDIPVVPYDPRAGRRRRRRPVAILLSLVVLAGLVVGIVVGGQRLLNLIDPSSQDFTGQGTGEVEIRVQEGDTLSDIARTLVDAGVIASIGPFVDAAEVHPDATGIQPGVYSLRREMSGQAALDLLLDPVARMVSRVAVPEGLTVEATFARIAEATGVTVEELTAAAADPVALGLPAYANGQLEGFLYPATYDFEPGTEPAEMLRQMIAQFVQVAGDVQLEQRAAALGRSPYEVVVVASMVQSETLLDEERPDVAQVIYNRLARDIPLGIDATLAYGLDKNGNDLTVTDLQTDSPYNTRTRTGLPPTPISAPGEPSLEAALSPTTGNLLYYVLESAEGSHFFTDDYAEFEAARQRCAEAGLGCGG